MVIRNSNMVNNKTVFKIVQSILSFTFSSSEFIDTAVMTFVDIVFLTFANVLFVTLIISLQAVTESSKILFKFLLFSQIHVLGFLLLSFVLIRYFCNHFDIIMILFAI